MSILIVVAHPDDEVLGAGGMLATLPAELAPSRACILAANADARTKRPGSEELRKDILQASGLLGLDEPILGDFPNIRLNTVPHLDLVQFIEEAIVSTDATTIFTHHPADLNNDHVQVSFACQAAARLFQRRNNIARLRELYFMEVLSSTEWAFPGGTVAFQPDTFFEIGELGLAKKIEALSCYKGVMRAYPHPRNHQTLRAQATMRGAQSGLQLAEGFQTAFRCLSQSTARQMTGR